MALPFVPEQQPPRVVIATIESHLSLIIFERKGKVCPEIFLSGTADVAGVVVHLLQSLAGGGLRSDGFYLAYCRRAGTVLPVTRQHVSCLIHQDLSDRLQWLA